MTGFLNRLIRLLGVLSRAGQSKPQGLTPAEVLARLAVNAQEAPELEPVAPVAHRPPVRRKRRYARTAALAVALVAALVASAAGVLAYFTAHGSGTATASSGLLGAPQNVSAVVSNSDVTVKWDTALLSDGTHAQGYTVERLDGVGNSLGNACGGATISDASGVGGHYQCTDSPGGAGTYEYRITARYASWSTPSAPTAQVTTTFGPATQIVLSGSTANLASGSSRLLTATVEDAQGHTVTSGADSSRTITFSQPSGSGSLTGLAGVAASGGVATDSVTGNQAGSVTVKASATLTGGATDSNTVSFTVTFGPAAKIVMSGSTSDLASGSTKLVTATIEDAAGNTVTSGPDSSASLTFSKASGTGTVTGLGAQVASGGVATDTVTGNLAGPVSIKAAGTLNSTPVTSGNTLDFNVVHGAASQIVLTGSAADLASATTRVLTATIEDAAGNTVSDGIDSSANVTFAQTTGSGSVSGLATVAASGGVAQDSVTGVTVGGVTLRASATVNLTLTTSNTLSFAVVPGAAAKLTFTAQPSSGQNIQATGTGTFSASVAIKDVNDNTVTTDNSTSLTLAIANNPGGGVLSCATTLTVTAASGVGSFTGCAITKAGTGYTLKATSSPAHTAPTNANAFNITAGTATTIAAVSGGGQSTTVNSAFGNPLVALVSDTNGNPVSGATVTFTGPSSGASGTFASCTSNPQTYSCVTTTGTDGKATSSTFTANTTASSYNVGATSAGTSPSPLNFALTNNPGPATKLAFLTSPGGTITGGSAFGTQPSVAVQDQYGNTVTGDSSTVSLSITAGTPTSGGPGTLSGCSGTETAGVTNFSGCKIDKIGNGYKLHATDASLTAADSNSFNVTTGPAALLAFTTSPSNSTTGIAFTTQPVVQVEDAGGNPVSSSASVTLAINSGAGTLACTTNPVTASSGVATFAGCKITLGTSGTFSLKATSGGLTTGVSNTFTVSNAASKFVITASPTSITAGGTTNLTITAVDSNGVTDPSYSGTKSLTFSGASTSPAGTIPTVTNLAGGTTNFGTAENMSFTNGVAQVSGSNNGQAKLYDAETATISATATGITTQTPATVTVTPGSASNLAFTGYTFSSANFGSAPQCTLGCTISSAGNNPNWSSFVSVTDTFGNIETNIGTAVSLTYTLTGTTGLTTPAGSLTIPASGAATTSAAFTWTHGTSSYSTTIKVTGGSYTFVQVAISK